ncbi:radical SAM protein [Paracraurococcus lichenis]|uniref:Radical SAM protein n=1 Tax=Paracraurococcus lichenis TaxID=3064888 RepID=A0ABT9DWY1_9PROT|nr:radical SAM protein [Paracraurococcus sp. LOR1-02]MDO9708407.1 radical SAM protein [Paracraurococcus sp. LOR1-02]
MSVIAAPATRPLDPLKFRDPLVTAKGETRATVALTGLRTLWVNTGTLCNITCRNCYIESSPRNDALAYLTAAELRGYLEEIARDALPVEEVGFTGGEPFLNRELPEMLRDVLSRGLRALVLTNAMKPMRNHAAALLALQREFGERLTLRVSLDHHEPLIHDLERQEGSFAQALEGLDWLARQGFRVHVAGRAAFGAEGEAAMREGFARLFAERGIPVDARDPVALMLFPEMDAAADVPEITTACWGILKKSPDSLMCASARMVVKRRGAERPAVLACTLLPYDPQFELGATLAEASRPVPLNHPHCARFCVLGGAACSR